MSNLTLILAWHGQRNNGAMNGLLKNRKEYLTRNIRHSASYGFSSAVKGMLKKKA